MSHAVSPDRPPARSGLGAAALRGATRRGVVLAIVATTALGGCTTTPDPSPAQSASASARASNAPGAPASSDPSRGVPTQSETGWGPIWDAVPPTFPVPAGAVEADAEGGPVSAAFTVSAAHSGPREIAEFYRDELAARGFGTGLDGPLEDGSFTVWASGGAACNALVTVLPRGAESLVTVLLGAGCPFA